MESGRYDGANRHHYFQGMTAAGALFRREGLFAGA
jgi:hypothetical protein